MMNKTRGYDFIFDIVNIVFMCAIMFVTLYPFIFVLFASISDPLEIAELRGILLWPRGFTLDSYRFVFRNPNILIGYRNTLIYVFLGTVINIAFTSLGAYVLSRKDYMLKKFFTILITFTMFFTGGIVPFFLLVARLNMLNTIWAIVLPTAISTWNLIIMRTSFQAIPDSLEESARIDGANDVQILIKIILPLSVPILAVMTLFYGVANWNAWFNAVLFLSDRNLFPLQVFLREILILDMSSAIFMMAADFESLRMQLIVQYAIVIATTAPILLLYPFLQRYFVKGIMIGAVKG